MPTPLPDAARSAANLPSAAALADAAGGFADAPPEFPADRRTVRVDAQAFASTETRTVVRFYLQNPASPSSGENNAVLHCRLAPGAAWIAELFPTETALAPGERQAVLVTVDTDEGRKAIRGGGAPSAPVRVLHQRLFGKAASVGEREDAVYVHLPVALCPACRRALDTSLAGGGAENALPEVCPFCFERLRPCPVCGAPNSWLARRCVLDASHIVRDSPDWNALGGGPSHEGSRASTVPITGLARRWSFPNVAPARRETALAWSAPVAAYGLVAAAAATPEGDAHLYAFDARTGAPLWEPFPLPDPVYPDRGGIAIAGGRIFAATVDGLCVAVDALRGTRVWEMSLRETPGTASRIYGAVVSADEGGERVLIAVAETDSGGSASGTLVALNGATGAAVWRTPLAGAPDAAPAFVEGRAFVHDDSGTVAALDAVTGAVLWTAKNDNGAGFDAAPVVHGGQVVSADSSGTVTCREAATGTTVWQTAVTNAPFAGTPAHDGLLVYLPADDGLHLVGAETGRSVRRYPTRQPVRSAPVLLGGSLLYGATDGNVYGVAPGRTVEKLYETGTIGSRIVAAPAVADGAFFVAATNGVLYALQLTSPPPSLSTLDPTAGAANRGA